MKETSYNKKETYNYCELSVPMNISIQKTLTSKMLSVFYLSRFLLLSFNKYISNTNITKYSIIPFHHRHHLPSEERLTVIHLSTNNYTV